MFKLRTQLIFQGILILILSSGLVGILSRIGGNFFRLELFGLIIVLLLSVIGMMAYHSWGKLVLFGVYFSYLVNLVLVWGVSSTLYVVLLVLALVGFFLSMPNRKFFPAVNKEMVKNEVPTAKKEVKKEEKELSHSIILDQPKVERKFSPGKYVASKNSNVYHEPKCDWAKKIAKSRQVWFDTKEEAWENGYKGHSCVK